MSGPQETQQFNMVQGEAIVKASGLIYVTDAQPGIYRKGIPGKFYYTDTSGKRIKDTRQLTRIQSLVIPPAWQQVWIALQPNAYLQVTGIDAAGRKQYRYHPEWTSRRSEQKYYRLLEFGKALPAARKRVALDLRRKEMDERKVLAICVSLLEKTLIRVGNRSYEQQYGSFGLSTLRNKHVIIKGNTLKLTFTGKKGVHQELEITDSRLSRLIRKCKDIPGQELFQYYTAGQEQQSIDSGKINQYIRDITGADFTAKDFRTWGGTLEALRQLAISNDTAADTHKVIVQVLDEVARKLGNTRAVCKSAYVFPRLLDAYEHHELDQYIRKIDAGQTQGKTGLDNDERVLLSFLAASSGKKAPRKKNTRQKVA